MTHENEDEIDDRVAYEAVEALMAAHPAHRAIAMACMWMGAEDGVDEFKHRISRRVVRFDRRDGRVIGAHADTGEETDDPAIALGELAIV